VAIGEQLRQIDPGNPTYHLNAGTVYAELQQFDAAEEAIRKAIELKPNLAVGHRSLVRILLIRNRKLPEAKALAQKLVELEPSAPNYSLLGEACRRNGDVAGAREALRRALELEPGNTKTHKGAKEPAQQK
jgi:Flp pilus assembly protein TadD